MPHAPEHPLAHRVAAPDAATAAPGYLPVTLSAPAAQGEPPGTRPVALLPTYCPFCGKPYAALLTELAPSCEAVS